MSSDYQKKDALVTVPKAGEVAVIAVTSTSARTDLSDTAQLGPAVNNGNFVSLRAEGGAVFFAFNSADSGTVDDTATSGATRCYKLEVGEVAHFIPRGLYTWLIHKTASGTATIRAYISSETDSGSP